MFLIYRSELQGIKSGTELFFNEHQTLWVIGSVHCKMWHVQYWWSNMSPRYNIQHIMECGLCKVLSGFNSLLNTSRSRWYNIGWAIRYRYIYDYILNMVYYGLSVKCNDINSPLNTSRSRWQSLQSTKPKQMSFKDREKGETGGFDSRLRWRYAIK